MVKYWLCVTNQENWKVVKDRKVWGVSDRNRMLLENVKPKDMMVSYVRPLRIRGIFKAVSKPFTSDEEIFNAAGFAEGELFPNRIKLEPVSMPEEPIEFKNLIPKLKFITNKKMWTGHLRRAMRTIPKEDFESIENAIRGK